MRPYTITITGSSNSGKTLFTKTLLNTLHEDYDVKNCIVIDWDFEKATLTHDLLNYNLPDGVYSHIIDNKPLSIINTHSNVNLVPPGIVDDERVLLKLNNHYQIVSRLDDLFSKNLRRYDFVINDLSVAPYLPISRYVMFKSDIIIYIIDTLNYRTDIVSKYVNFLTSRVEPSPHILLVYNKVIDKKVRSEFTIPYIPNLPIKLRRGKVDKEVVKTVRKVKSKILELIFQSPLPVERRVRL